MLLSPWRPQEATVKKSSQATRQSRPKQTPPSGMEPLAVTKKEAAGLTGVSPLTITLWEKQGILKPLALPSTRRRRGGSRFRRVLYALATIKKLIADAEARG
jgi:hypothetical protein